MPSCVTAAATGVNCPSAAAPIAMPESAMPATARLALRMSAAVMEMSATASLGSAVEALYGRLTPCWV